ncbi:MAG: hypothetical protein ACTSQE_08085 [Candidatus Heimdallarchaeaceae archaeon]
MKKIVIKKVIRTFSIYFIITLVIVSSIDTLDYSISDLNEILESGNTVENDKESNIKINEPQNYNSPLIKLDVRSGEEGYYSYTPINKVSGSSNQFSAIDNLTVNHGFDINLTYDGEDSIINSYEITRISDYNNVSLNYNITKITAISDYYPVEDDAASTSVEELSYYDNIRMAQEFEVKWDYAQFEGSKIYLDTTGTGDWGTYELEIFLVSAQSNGKPNMTNIISSDVNDPYDTNNLLPSSSSTNIHYYDFTDVILPKGKYFIVANLSTIDTSDDGSYKHFAWHWKGGTDPIEGATYYWDYNDNDWTSVSNYDYVLLPRLLPCYQNGIALEFASVNQIVLEDNGTVVSSNDATINALGLHELTANTSVQIILNNSYQFSKQYSGSDISTIYSALNSTYWSYDISWNISWTSPQIDYSPYSNLNRIQFIQAPGDWSNTFTFYFNDTNPLDGKRENDGYSLLLNNNNSAANWKLTTTSPNYIQQVTLLEGTQSTDRFLLGYWTANGTHATGYNGSTLTSEVYVKNDGAGTPTNELTGTMNFTLFNRTGHIIPKKSSLASNLIFNDYTFYTLGGLVNDSAGFYSNDIIFDPSVDESDLPGFWTALVYWNNGTEVGIYSLRIVVQTQTIFNIEWEITPNSNTWTTNDITRKSGDSILINSTYYNITEPFFSGLGNPIPDATVSYSTSWGVNNNLNDYHPIYNGSIPVGLDVGDYTIDFVATGSFLENHTSNFNLNVFYESDIIPQYTSFTTNYTNDAIYVFEFRNVTGNNAIFPDDLTVSANGTTITPTDYSYVDDAGNVKLTIDTGSANLDPGYWEILVSAYKTNFRKSYTEENATYTFNLTITDIMTTIVVDSADSEVYVYYNATIDVRFVDTNHTTNITGATYEIFTNTDNVDITVTESSGIYHVDLKNNNYSISEINVYLNISKFGYISQNNYLLANLTVKLNPTETTVDNAASECYIGYNASIEISFNDTQHSVGVEGATVIDVSANMTSSLDWWVEDLGDGNYNITFLNTNSSIEALNITITIVKNGYVQSEVWVIIPLEDIPTHYEFFTSPPDNVTYLETEDFKIFYWDDISSAKIVDADVSFTGNLTTVANVVYTSYSNGTYIITISLLTDFDYYELIVYVDLPGYTSQIITIYMDLLSISTVLSSTTGTNQEVFAIDTLDLFLEYKDEDLDSAVEADGNEIVFAIGSGNESLSINYYFDSITYGGYAGTLHLFTFDPKETTATGYVFVFNITLYKFGYENKSIIIYLNVKITPTDIQVDNENLVIDSSQQGTFTIFYIDTLSNDNITGATIEVIQLNGSVSDIEGILAYSSAPLYKVDINPDDVFAVEKTFMFNITLYKAGYANQSIIIYLTVVYNPTSISVLESQIIIYADETAQFTLTYINNNTGESITQATVTINPLNGTDYLTNYYTEGTSPYYVIIDPDDATSVGYIFEIEITLSKGGFASQTVVVYLYVKLHPTSISSSSEEINIYADEQGAFTIYFENYYNNTIENANYTLELISGDLEDIVSNSTNYNQAIKAYILTFDFVDSRVANKTFVFNITMWKVGFENQSIVLTVKIYDYLQFTLVLNMNADSLHRLSTVTFTVTLTEALLQALSGFDYHLAYSPIGENVTITLFMFDGSGEIIDTDVFNITIVDTQNGMYYGEFKLRVEQWNVQSLRVTAEYKPVNGNIVAQSFNEQTLEVKFPYLSDLFFEYLIYMTTGLSIIAVFFVSLTIYFAFIRPKKQKQQARRKQYRDTVSNILKSVMSMKKILIVHRETSSPVYELDLGSDIRVSSALVTGFLQAVSSMAKEITGKDRDSVKKLDYGDFIVSSIGDENYITYIFSDKELSEDIINGLSEFSKFFGKRFAEVADNWIGSLEVFKQKEKVILRNISEHFFVWTLYPLVTNPTKEKEIKKLGPMSQKIIRFVKDTKEATIGLILQYYDRWPKEETISLIFALVEDHYLSTKRF